MPIQLYSAPMKYKDQNGDYQNIIGISGNPGRGIASIVLNNDYTLTINFTDNTSTTTSSIRGNGIASIEKTSTVGLVDTYTIIDSDGGTSTFTITNGNNGTDGTTFTPSVNAEGVISWTNDNNKQNPSSISIKGPKGDPGDDYILTAQDKSDIATQVSDAIVETVTGANPVIVGVTNHRYMCGEVATISITPPVSGIIDVIFSSGTTAAVLTVPNTVKFPDWFDPASLNESVIYEISILDGVYGAVGIWS